MMDNDLMNLEKKGGDQSTETGAKGSPENAKGGEDRLKQIHQSTVTLCQMPPMEKPTDQLKLCEAGDVTAA